MPLIVETLTPEQLIASNFPTESQAGIAGEVLVKYTPVVQNGTTFKWHIATTTATGVVVSDAVLDGSCTVFVAGTFNLEVLNWHASLTTDAAKQYSLQAPCFAKKLV